VPLVKEMNDTQSATSDTSPTTLTGFQCRVGSIRNWAAWRDEGISRLAPPVLDRIVINKS
jgi:hypothetical protein